MQETRKQKMTKKTMTTQHPSIPGGSNYKIKGEFFTTLSAWVNRLGQFYFKVLDCKMRFHSPSPPPSPQKLKICSCKSYYVICVTMYCWNTEAIHKKIEQIYCNVFCNLVLLWATKKPFPIEPRKPSINSRFYLYGYYSNMFSLSYIFLYP